MRLESPHASYAHDVAWEASDARRDQLDARSWRLESLGDVAGGVVHDVNNLLAGIMSYAGLVSAHLADEMERHGLRGDPSFVSLLEDVDQITEVSARAASLTQQVLAFSRSSPAPAEVVDVSSVVAGMEAVVRRCVGRHATRFSTTLGAHLPAVRLDRSQLERVIMNLAVNARDAMPSGGLLTIETSQVLDPSAALPAIRVTVSDTGIGMAEEVAARALEPFFTTKPLGQGTGLGLATVHRIVAQAGGRMSIRSCPGAGTTVCVDLPTTTDVRTSRRPVRSDALAPANGETILLVDDEPLVREPVRRVLEGHGYTVLAAATSEEALAIAQAHLGPIDLLLTDVAMPGCSGPQLSVGVARRCPAVKVLFTSGYGQEVLEQHGVLVAAHNLLAKPSSAPDLLRKVRAVLDGR